MHADLIVYTFTIFLAFLMLAYYYWKDASGEGFGDTKIFDSFFLLSISGLVGGKFLFRYITYDYLRYSLFSSPLILEGILVGGGLALYIYIRKKHLDGWKLGDSISSGLVLFKTIMFFGFFLLSKETTYLLISLSFGILFILLRYLRNVKMYGSSKMFFEMKRYKKVLFTGVLFAVYLTVSSVIAMIFLLTNINTNSGFWIFQICFYILVFIASLVLFRAKMQKQLHYDIKSKNRSKN